MIACWLGYQRKRVRHCPIREIPVVTELAALLHASTRQQGLRIGCERTFSFVLDASPDTHDDYRRKRVDIPIGPAMGAATHAIEVKVPGKIECSGSRPWAEYRHRLTWLMQQNSSTKLRPALTTVSALPRGWLSDVGRALRTEQQLPYGTIFQVRWFFRALPLLPRIEGESGWLHSFEARAWCCWSRPAGADF